MTTRTVLVSSGLLELIRVRAAARRTSVQDYVSVVVVAEAQAASAEEYALAISAERVPEAI